LIKLKKIFMKNKMAQSPIASGTTGACAWTLTGDKGNLTLTISGHGAMDDFCAPWTKKYRKSINSVVIQDGVTTIGGNAFRGCGNLTAITIPNSVTEINWAAFAYCRNLTAVNIPSSVTGIDGRVFDNCRCLTAINVDVANPEYSSADGVLFNKDQTELIKCPPGRTGNYTIPDSVTEIRVEAFDGCRYLTAIIIPDSVTEIGLSVFNDCSGLTSLTIPNSLTDLDDFCGCRNLIAINVDATHPAYSSIDGLLFNKDQTELITCPPGRTGRYIIPDSVTKIGERAFYECSGLTSLAIPDSVTEIGNWAFAYCSGLTAVTLPNSVTTIGYEAFDGCSKLVAIIIPDSVTKIDKRAFSDCYNLTAINVDVANPVYSSVDGVLFNKDQTILTTCPPGQTESYTIPNSVTTIGEWAFANCSGLTEVTIPNSITTIGGDAFRACSGLAFLTIPDSVTEIGNWAFVCCRKLTAINVDVANPAYVSIDGMLFNKDRTTLRCYPAGKTGGYTIPNSVTEIGEAAFADCRGLTSITIPDSVTEISRWVFDCCRKLTAVTNLNPNPQISSDVFYKVNLSACTLRVPAGAVAAYRKANVWKDFGTIVGI
jgi:hypothetical protein